MNPKRSVFRPRLSAVAILLFGGAGNTSGHVGRVLARAGYMPVLLDNLSTGHDWAVKGGSPVGGR